MEDWIQLTEEDLGRAQRLSRNAPATPAVITIRAEDVTDEPPSRPEPHRAILTITDDDLRPAGNQPAAPPNIATLEQLMFNLVNAARQSHLPGWLGTANLTWHPALAAVARQHSADMLRRQYVDHTTPEGIAVAQRLAYHKINYMACGENIGIVYGEAAHSQQAVYDIQNAFMNQPRSLTNHRGNLLNPIWTHIGIGIAYNPDGSLVVTQNFISAPGAKFRGQ